MTKTEIKKRLREAKSLSEIFPLGATDHDLCRFGWFFGSCQDGHRLYRTYQYVPRAIKRLNVESSAWSMMISKAAYGGVEQFFDETDRYNYTSYLKKYEALGGNKKTFMDSLETQRKHLLGVTVHHNVGTDSEGCTYNSIEEPETMATIPLIEDWITD